MKFSRWWFEECIKSFQRDLNSRPSDFDGKRSHVHPARSLDAYINDGYVVIRLVCLGIYLRSGDRLNHLHALRHPPEHSVLVVQPRGGDDGDEKLGPVRVRAGVGHAKGVRPVVAQGRVELVLELVPPYALAAGACAFWIAGLYHEALWRDKRLSTSR